MSASRHENLGKINAVLYLNKYPEVSGVHEWQHICSEGNFEDDYPNRRSELLYEQSS